MESLSYAFEGRGLLFADDTDFQVDDLARSRNLLKKWDGEQLLIPHKDAVESMGFGKPVLPDMTKKPVFSNQFSEISNDDKINHFGKSALPTSTFGLNSLMEFSTRFYGSVNRANENLAAPKEPNSNRFSVDDTRSSPPELSGSAKRARITTLQSQIPTCQVLGCNKDLSTSKDYHKRHKVCDVHSKTSVVIVNGIQQRFCQQCSRFHKLIEFDEGKRSCRKRLAGHNERRRKPQFDSHLGSAYFTMDAAKTSLLFSSLLPGGFFGYQGNESTNQVSQVAEPLKFGESLPKSVLRLHGMGKPYPSKNCLNAAALYVPELSVGSNSSSALSLLSAQSQSSLSNSAGMSMAHPLATQENHNTNFTTLPASTKSAGKGTSKNLNPTTFSSSGLHNEGFPDASFSIGFDLSQEPDANNLNSCLSPEGANTVNLLELSLHLQRVEQQKSCTQFKLEDGIFCHSTTS